MRQIGETRARLKGEGGEAKELEIVIDARATFVKIPRQVAERLGLRPAYEVEVELGDGRRVTEGGLP